MKANKHQIQRSEAMREFLKNRTSKEVINSLTSAEKHNLVRRLKAPATEIQLDNNGHFNGKY